MYDENSEAMYLFEDTKCAEDQVDEDQTSRNFRFGVCIAAVTTICNASSSAFAQALAGFVPEFELNTFRFTAQMLITLPIVYFKKLSLWVPKREVPWLVITSLLHNAYNVLYYKASIYLPLGAFAGVSRGFILIIVGFVSLVITKECHYFTIIAVVLCVTGMILIDQPGFIFHDILPVTDLTPTYTPICENKPVIYTQDIFTTATSNMSNTSGIMLNSTITESAGSNETLGYILLLSSSIVTSILYFIINRKFKDIDRFVIIFWIGTGGVIVSLVVSAIFEDFTFPRNTNCLLLLIGHGFSAGLGTLGNVKSLELLIPVVFSLVGSLQVVLLCLAQYTIMQDINPGKRNAVEVTGVVIAFIGNVTSPLYTICSDLYKKRKKRDKK